MSRWKREVLPQERLMEIDEAEMKRRAKRKIYVEMIQRALDYGPIGPGNPARPTMGNSWDMSND